MNQIIIESRLDFTTYRSAMFRLFYRKPLMMVITILGILMLVLAIAYAILVFHKVGQFPYIPMILGMIFVFLMPYSVYSQARRNYAGNPRIKEKLIYTFDADKITVTGESFKNKILWNNIVKIQELKSSLLLYHSNASADIIPHRAFSEEDLNALKSLVATKEKIATEYRKPH